MLAALNKRSRKFFPAIILLISFGHIHAQERHERGTLFLDDWPYELIEYWINNGSQELDFVMEQPYAISTNATGLSRDNRWANRYQEYTDAFYGSPGLGKAIFYARGNGAFVSGERVERPGTVPAPVRHLYLFENRNRLHYNAVGQINLQFPAVSLVNRTVINSEFKEDPRFAGDTGEWIYGRINDAYMNVNAGNFGFFLGRTDRNWGALNSPGMILSNNPYSYDHAYLSYTFHKFRFSMLVSRLEDLQGLNLQSTSPDSLVEARRYITAHRFAFSPSSRFQIAFSEIAVYGGPNRGFEFGFLNPMNFYYIVQRNNNQQMNGLWALDVFIKPTAKLNLSAQFLIDDVIVNNEPGENDREKFPDRVGVSFKLSEADYILAGQQFGIEYTRLSNRTYQSFRTWENFQYRGKSLGYPQASIEKVKFFTNYFGLYPFIFNFHISYQRAGEVDLSDPFTGEKENFPVGVVEKKWDTGFSFRYFPTVSSEVSARLGYEHVDNYNSLPAQSFSNFRIILGIHLNLSVNLPI